MLNYSPSIDVLFHALADPTRRVIVERLSRAPASVSALAEPLEMSLSAVMQHLEVLEASGIVRSEKLGRVRTCSVEPAALRTVEQWVGARKSEWERRFDRLGEFLDRQEAERSSVSKAGSKPRSKSQSRPRSQPSSKRGRKQ